MNVVEIIGIILIVLIVGITFYRAPAVSISYFKEAGTTTISIFKVIWKVAVKTINDFKVEEAVNDTAFHDIDKEMGG